MITPSFGLTATERVLPKLALDFTTASLDPRITFTRTTDATHPATYINSIGYVTLATNNQPRFDYDPTTLTCKGLLIEEARTNIIINSNDFSQASWAKTAITVSSCPDVSPSGTTDAQTLTNSGGTGNCNSVVVGTSGAAYTFSIWVKRRTGTGTIFLVDANGGNNAIVPTANWQRFSVTVTSSSTTIRSYIRVVTAGDAIDVYGAQTEAGAFATSYIPTTTTALTRNADVATMTGTNFSDWFNASEGTFEVQGTPITSASSGALSADDGTNNQRMQMRSLSGGGQAFIVDGGVTQANLATGTWAAGTNGKCSFAYKLNSFVCAAGGAAPATDTAGTVPTVNRLCIGGSNGVNQTYFNGVLSKLNYWPQRCTNAEVQSFSKV